MSNGPPDLPHNPVHVAQESGQWSARIHPDLKKAANSCRLLGVLFVLLGLCPMFPLLDSPGFTNARNMTTRILTIITMIVLVGPGVWYFVAARLIRRGDARAIRATIIVAAVQAALVALFLTVALLGGRPGRRVSIPSIVCMFFLPALGAAVYQLVRARAAAMAMPSAPAFEPLPPRAVLPVSDDPAETPAERLRPYD